MCDNEHNLGQKKWQFCEKRWCRICHGYDINFFQNWRIS